MATNKPNKMGSPRVNHQLTKKGEEAVRRPAPVKVPVVNPRQRPDSRDRGR